MFDARGRHLRTLGGRGEGPGQLTAANGVVMPDSKAPVETLTVDDAGRLWVGRPSPPGGQPGYDVLSRDGRFLAAVRLGVGLAASIPLRIRHGHVYAVKRDSSDVPYLMRAPLPPEVGH